MKDLMIELADKHFPKGDKARGQAMVLVAEILVASKQELSRLLDMWKDDIVTNFTPKCSFCGIKSRKVVGQVAKGISAQEDNHLPRNWGYYCQRCYDVGSELEREAMYG